MPKDGTAKIERLDEAVADTEPVLVVGLGRGHGGKAQPDDALVLTPLGFRPIKSLSEGDLITCPDGKSAAVTGIFPQGEKDIYQIQFADGRTVECCDDHLWKVWCCHGWYGPGSHTTRERFSGKWKIKPLSELRQIFSTGKRESLELAIPLVSPYVIEYPPQNLPIPAYALGAILGDGGITTDTVRLTTADSEILEAVLVGLPEYRATPAGRYGFSFVMRNASKFTRGSKPELRISDTFLADCPQVGPRGSRLIEYQGTTQTLPQWAKLRNLSSARVFSRIAVHGWSVGEALGFEARPLVVRCFSPLVIALKELGLMGKGSHNKFVPEIYKRGSVMQRLAILQGLLDTDGSVGWHGTSASFTSTSEQLTKDVQDIAWSLGANAKISPRQTYCSHKGTRKAGRPSWRVTIVHPDVSQMFSLPRKVAQCKNKIKQHRLRITSIKAIGRQQARCITVDHPDHLYVTNNYVVTHNSTALSELSWRAQAQGRSVIVADGDVRSRTLAGLFPQHATSPETEELPDFKTWFSGLLNRMVKERRSAVLDLGGGDRVLQEYGRDLNLVGFCAKRGIKPLALYVLGPEEEDLRHVLAIWRSGYFRPDRALLLLNEGVIRQGKTVAGAFDATMSDPGFAEMIQGGAKPILLQRLACMSDVRQAGAGFYGASVGQVGTGCIELDPVSQYMTESWLADLEEKRAALGAAGWLP